MKWFVAAMGSVGISALAAGVALGAYLEGGDWVLLPVSTCFFLILLLVGLMVCLTFRRIAKGSITKSSATSLPPTT